MAAMLNEDKEPQVKCYFSKAETLSETATAQIYTSLRSVIVFDEVYISAVCSYYYVWGAPRDSHITLWKHGCKYMLIKVGITFLARILSGGAAPLGLSGTPLGSQWNVIMHHLCSK